jgi:SAM-dependent methyltransferase
MSELAQHWDDLFARTDACALGWYESDPSQTLKWLEEVPAGGRTFVAGAGTTGLVEALLARGDALVVNDISAMALAQVRDRLAVDAAVEWVCQDVAKPLPENLVPVDLWVDRAVLHFLHHEEEILGYFANLRCLVRPGGHVLLAEFSSAGALKCAGLEVHRYSLEEMCRRMDGFEMIGHEEYLFHNPKGDPRPYLYCLFRRL